MRKNTKDVSQSDAKAKCANRFSQLHPWIWFSSPGREIGRCCNNVMTRRNPQLQSARLRGSASAMNLASARPLVLHVGVVAKRSAIAEAMRGCYISGDNESEGAASGDLPMLLRATMPRQNELENKLSRPWLLPTALSMFETCRMPMKESATAALYYE